MNDLPVRPAADIGVVEDRFFTLRNFPLTDGTVMPEALAAARCVNHGAGASDRITDVAQASSLGDKPSDPRRRRGRALHRRREA